MIKSILILCFGDPDCKYDSFGPTMGTRLSKKFKYDPDIEVIGTTSHPLVGNEGLEYATELVTSGDYGYVIAIDAAVSDDCDNCLFVSDIGLKPGEGLNKVSDYYGDIGLQYCINDFNKDYSTDDMFETLCTISSSLIGRIVRVLKCNNLKLKGLHLDNIMI